DAVALAQVVARAAARTPPAVGFRSHDRGPAAGGRSGPGRRARWSAFSASTRRRGLAFAPHRPPPVLSRPLRTQRRAKGEGDQCRPRAARMHYPGDELAAMAEA